MRKLKLFCLIALLGAAPLLAYTEAEPGGFAVSLEYLYLSPQIDQPYFAISAPAVTPVSNRRFANCLNWESGYRVDILYGLCDCNDWIGFRWTQIPHFSSSSTARGSDLIAQNSPNLTAATEVSVKDSFNFYYLDFLFGRKMVDCCGLDLAMSAGLQYTHLKFNEKLTQVGTDDVTTCLRSRFCGIGPEFNLDFRYDLCGCFSFTGRGVFSLLAYNRDSKLQSVSSSTADNIYDYSSDDCWFVTPMTDLRLGLSSTWCGFCCMDFDLEIGYEFLALFDGASRIWFSDSVDGQSMDMLMNFTLHGPYIHLGATF